MRHTFEIPLNIPDVTIESVRTNPVGHLEITVKSTVEGTPCHIRDVLWYFPECKIVAFSGT